MGSYRIWMQGLYRLWSDLGYSVTYGRQPKAGILIYPKGDEIAAQSQKKAHPELVIGVINPPPQPTNLDFCICGSIEERDALLAFYPKVLIYPLIEQIFSNWKTHKDITPLCVGYHGNSIHLNSLEPNILRALADFSATTEIRLLIITDDRWEKQWVHGRPRNIETDLYLWDESTIEERLLEIDIGIVPCCYPNIRAKPPRWGKRISKKLINFEDDYILRFKQKANAGRSFVFHQLGIPVIADFTPSHFHILGDPECGVLAHSPAGWIDGLNRLRTAEERNRVAQNASDRFHEYYDPIKHAKNLHRHLQDSYS